MVGNYAIAFHGVACDNCGATMLLSDPVETCLCPGCAGPRMRLAAQASAGDGDGGLVAGAFAGHHVVEYWTYLARNDPSQDLFLREIGSTTTQEDNP